MDNRNNRFLGIELGSTRIKAVVMDARHEVTASASHIWENRLEEGYWTYRLEDVWAGLQACIKALGAARSGVTAMGVSAMMHGYLAFDEAGRQLVPFRTWRNTTTGQASERLSKLFGFNIPQRWSVAHLYQAMRNGEPHVKDIAFLTTLAGYVHWRLTGEFVLGAGDASGMFPMEGGCYHAGMLRQFEDLTQCSLHKLLPAVRMAGKPAGFLTEEGARLLDPAGQLRPGIAFCPPEGDAGTGMTATNSVAPGNCNVSAGTSIFAMAVLEQPLQQNHAEIDMVTTPAGKPVAMVHCNSCTSDLDAWAGLFRQAAGRFGKEISVSALYETLYAAALEGEPDGGGIVSYNFYAGEPVAGLVQGCPMLCRDPGKPFRLENIMRSLVFSAVASLRLGMDILAREGVRLRCITGHGGFFKAGTAGQRLLAAALNVPVVVRGSAGEGGAWGIALLAAYMTQKEDGETLEDYLADNVFAADDGVEIQPDESDRQGFEAYLAKYQAGLAAVERATEIF